MKSFIDNGHGQFAPCNRSPDGQLRKAFYNREIAHRIILDLLDRGYDAELLVPEDNDISLKVRCRRVNSWCLLQRNKPVEQYPRCIMWRNDHIETLKRLCNHLTLD